MRASLALIGSLVLLTVAVGPVAAQTDCEAARCAVQAAINANCSCSAAPNHGKFVSCVAHQVKALSTANPPQIPTNCKGKVTSCAARSICGKSGFVTCQIPLVSGTCDTSSGTCSTTTGVLATGTCDTSSGTGVCSPGSAVIPPATSCMANSDCVLTCSSDRDCRLATGTCDTSSGTGVCSPGSAVVPPATSCTMNSDCVILTKCKIKSSADKCTAAGGAAGTSPTCCSTCATP